jgi:hypothetical protein
MSSWDSIYALDSTLKVKGTNARLPLHARVLYDTPCMVGYSIMVLAEDLRNSGIANEEENDYYFTLKSWEREASTIDARSMDDSDVYDLFSTNIEKYVSKLQTEGLSPRQLQNIIKNG